MAAWRMVQSVRRESSSDDRSARSSCFSSWKAVLSASQTWVVSAVRTMRPFSRAAVMQLATEEGLSRSKNRKLSMLRCTGSPVFLREGMGHAGGLQQAVPFAAVALGRGQQADAAADFQKAGDGIGALHVAGDPVEVVGGAAQHFITPPAPRCP
jgi:hypothetical protein